MTGTSPQLPVQLPRIAAEPEPHATWTADLGVYWRNRRRVALLVAAAVGLHAAFWWWTSDPILAVLVLGGVVFTFASLMAVVAVLAGFGTMLRLDREYGRRLSAVESGQASLRVRQDSDHGDLRAVQSVLRNQRLDEVAAKRAQRQGVPGQRTGEGS